MKQTNTIDRITTSKSTIRAAIAGVMLLALTACSFSTVLTVLIVVGEVAKIIQKHVLSPPAAELANFDATDVSSYLEFDNVALSSSNGDVTITIYDEVTRQELGQNTFAFNVSGSNVVTFSNPSTVTSWVQSFSNYQGGTGFIDVEIEIEYEVAMPPPGESGTVSSTDLWNDVPVASSSLMLFQDCPQEPNFQICA